MVDKNPLLALAMVLVLYSWAIIPIAIGIFKRVKRDMCDALERGEKATSVFANYARVSVLLVVTCILLFITLSIVVLVGAFGWDMLTEPSYSPEFEEYAV